MHKSDFSQMSFLTEPETTKHLNTLYQHCDLCRTPRMGWNKKWSDIIITVLHNIHDQSISLHQTDLVLLRCCKRLCILGPHGAIERCVIIIFIIFFLTLGIKDPEGFGKKLEENVSEWPLLRAVLKHKGIM